MDPGDYPIKTFAERMNDVTNTLTKAIDMLNKDRKAEARDVLQKLLKRMEEA